MQQGIYNSALGCTYGAVGFSLKMNKTERKKDYLLTLSPKVDSSYYLPVLMQRYFVQSPIGQQRWASFSKYAHHSLTQSPAYLTSVVGLRPVLSILTTRA
jgi:hypothetical protein